MLQNPVLRGIDMADTGNMLQVHPRAWIFGHALTGRHKGLEVVMDPVTKQSSIPGLTRRPLHTASDFGQLLALTRESGVAGTAAGEATTVLTLHVTRGTAIAVAAAGAAPTGGQRSDRTQPPRLPSPHTGGSVGKVPPYCGMPEDGCSFRGRGCGGEGNGRVSGVDSEIGEGGEVMLSKLTFVEVAAGPSERASTAGRMGLAALHGQLSAEGISPVGKTLIICAWSLTLR